MFAAGTNAKAYEKNNSSQYPVLFCAHVHLPGGRVCDGLCIQQQIWNGCRHIIPAYRYSSSLSQLPPDAPPNGHCHKTNIIRECRYTLRLPAGAVPLKEKGRQDFNLAAGKTR
jgi:hypothetical protein